MLTVFNVIRTQTNQSIPVKTKQTKTKEEEEESHITGQLPHKNSQQRQTN